MCGIVGCLSNSPINVEMFISCRDRMKHRGPDAAGLWHNQERTVLLGHRRLSIIDLSDTGRQPMTSLCGRFTIVFNGEIYNYKELKTELKELGHHFLGSGDTEVVLAAYLQWKEKCLERFNGMFAIAIWDHGTSDTSATLFIARDRAGKKPLYYSHQGRTLFFSSELKGIPKEMRGNTNFKAVNYYLALGYIPGAMCISQGVCKLPPGHAARFSLKDNNLLVWKWWELPVSAPSLKMDENEALEETTRLLHNAVRIRLRSDVPIGVLLSGGLDSSLVVACAANASKASLKTFTIGFPGSKLDETNYAAVVAEHFSTDHYLLELPEPSLNTLDELSEFVDEPIADSSIIPTYLVSKLTAGHVKVALGGDGGDELFGGYSDYTTAFKNAARIGWLPDLVFKGGAFLAGMLPTGMPGRNKISSLRGGPFQALVWGTPYFDIKARKRILSPDILDCIRNEIETPEMLLHNMFLSGIDPVDCMTRTHFRSILPDDFLVKVDRASMAVGLEMRAPFLDKELVEFAFGRLPGNLKVLGTEGRLLQKKLGKKLLPPNLNINRKQGFSIPLNDWLQKGDNGWLDDTATLLGQWINEKELSRLRDNQKKGYANGSRLFSLIMMGLYIKNMI